MKYTLLNFVKWLMAITLIFVVLFGITACYATNVFYGLFATIIALAAFFTVLDN